MTAMRNAMAGSDVRMPADRVMRPGQPFVQQLMWEWPARAFFGALLAGLAIAATLAGGFYFSGFLALIATAAAREWHRMIGGKRFGLELALTAGTIAIALVLTTIGMHAQWPVLALAVGGVSAAAASRSPAGRIWNGAGALYIGVPAVCLVGLRMNAIHGGLVVLALFIVIWAADSGAFVCGRVLGGPKLVPALSPNKTWTGIAGGIVLPALALSIYAALLGGNYRAAALTGALLAIAAHAGDLFESWLKRRVGRKNSGNLIPGHGGVLDRIDSTLAVAPLAALLVFVLGFDLLFGARL